MQIQSNDIVTMNYNVDTQRFYCLSKTAGRIYRETDFGETVQLSVIVPLKMKTVSLRCPYVRTYQDSVP